MRRIIVLLSVFFLCSIQSFAFSGRLDVSSEEVFPGERFSLDITIEGTGSIDISVLDIEGIENFFIRGRSEQSSIKIINGVSSITKKYSIILEPQKVGEFMLGPVFLGEKEDAFIDESITIVVTTGNTEEVENDDLESLENNEDFIEELHDIKGVKSENENKNIVIFLLLFLIFILTFYYLLKSFFISGDEKEEVENEEKYKVKKIDYEYEIKHLKRRLTQFSRKDFYESFSMLFCNFIEEKYSINGACSMTYEEIKEKKEIIGDELLSLFEAVYFTLFDKKREDNEKKRKDLLKDFLSIIKK